jgi:gliding motility-associated lipoprotein GldH
MKTKFLFIFCAILFFVSCKNSNSFYSDFQTFGAENQWKKTDVKTFNFTIQNNEKYNLALKFSHVYDFQFESVPMQITIINPNGKQEIVPFDLQLKDASGKDIGECAGDICDLTYVFKENASLEKGNYTIKVSQNFAHSYLPNAIGVGVDVTVAK